MRAHEFIGEGTAWEDAGFGTPGAALLAIAKKKKMTGIETEQDAVNNAKKIVSVVHTDKGAVHFSKFSITSPKYVDATLDSQIANDAYNAIKQGWKPSTVRTQPPVRTRPPQPPLHPDLERAMHPPMPTRDELHRDREQRRRGEEMVRKVGDEIRARRQREFNFAND